MMHYPMDRGRVKGPRRGEGQLLLPFARYEKYFHTPASRPAADSFLTILSLDSCVDGIMKAGIVAPLLLLLLAATLGPAR